MCSDLKAAREGISSCPSTSAFLSIKPSKGYHEVTGYGLFTPAAVGGGSPGGPGGTGTGRPAARRSLPRPSRWSPPRFVLQVSRPHPSDHPLLILFVVGGVTVSEAKMLKDLVPSLKPGTQVPGLLGAQKQEGGR